MLVARISLLLLAFFGTMLGVEGIYNIKEFGQYDNTYIKITMYFVGNTIIGVVLYVCVVILYWNSFGIANILLLITMEYFAYSRVIRRKLPNQHLIKFGLTAICITAYFVGGIIALMKV